MPLNIEDIPAPEDLEKLLEAAKAELAQVERPKDFRRMASRERVVELTAVMLTSWHPLIELIEKELSPERAAERKAQLDRLDKRGWVFYAADLAAEEVFSDTSKKQRSELAKAVKENDRYLMSWAIPLFGHDPHCAAILSDISRGTGKRDDAEDVQRLVKLYRKHWDLVASKVTEITTEYLDQAAQNAAKQLALLRGGKQNPARKDADAAYWLWYQDYVEVMQLGRYLTWREPDSVQRFPGVQEERSGPAAQASNSAQDDELVQEDDADFDDDDEQDEEVDELLDEQAQQDQEQQQGNPPAPVDENG